MIRRFAKNFPRAFIALLMLIFAAQISYAASVPYPRVKPAAPNISSILDEKDARAFKNGLAAADRRNWRDVNRYKNQITHPVASQNLSDWPRMTGIRAKAEKKLWSNKLSSQATIGWFQNREPVSGEGRAVLLNSRGAKPVLHVTFSANYTGNINPA